jgi:hypothetical protein
MSKRQIGSPSLDMAIGRRCHNDTNQATANMTFPLIQSRTRLTILVQQA